MDKWLSVYIYVDGDQNKFLKHEVYKKIAELEENDLILKFFFIRYFEEGHHIRLRLLSNKNIQFEQLDTFVNAWLTSLKDKEENKYNIINYRNIEYVPEIDRYGGSALLPICETFFYESSRIILNLIHKTHGDYSYYLAVSIQMQFVFAKILLQRNESIVSFFGNYAYGWAERTNAWYEAYYGRQGNFKDEIFQHYESSYLKQKELFTALITDVNDSIEKYIVHDISDIFWLRYWIQALENLKIHLNEEAPDLFAMNTNIHLTIYEIYLSLMHMTNNRLGITNMDESFVGFILFNYCKDINQ